MTVFASSELTPTRRHVHGHGHAGQVNTARPTHRQLTIRYIANPHHALASHLLIRAGLRPEVHLSMFITTELSFDVCTHCRREPTRPPGQSLTPQNINTPYIIPSPSSWLN
ncbi:hypothetical protein J6590_062934 [Homalodisca vitripennis]|nr:hypothetical protein J6590_062934 [Homalodisca vitripennis]